MVRVRPLAINARSSCTKKEIYVVAVYYVYDKKANK